MSFCIYGLSSGAFCVGDTTNKLQGAEIGLTHTGLGVVALVGIAAIVLILRDPA